MANSVTMTLGYTGTDFTRKMKLDNLEAGALSSVKSKILAVNASIAGGTDGGLKEFFRADDYDASDSNNIVGEFSGITAAQIDSVETEYLDIA